MLPANWQTTDAYPLLTLLDGRTIRQVSEFPGVSDQPPVTLSVEKTNITDDELVARVLADINEGGIAGVIVNTVKHAQALAELFTPMVDTMVLHSALLAPERVRREQLVQKAIGKGATRPERLVVIGTQVLEQSLDIDFDILYTDIAPMDLLLQRAGRLHRHAIDRPAKLKWPKLVVMGVESLGHYGDENEAVYAPYLLTRTDWQLGESITFPGDISRLVQQVYGEAPEPPFAQIEEQHQQLQDIMQKKRDRAKVFQIKKPSIKAGKPIFGWLNKMQPDVDKNEQLAQAAVRDIEESIEVILVAQVDGEYRLLDGQKLSSVTPKDIAQQLIRLPNRVTRFKVDTVITTLEKQTLQHFPYWQENSWLKGAIAVVLDDNLSAELVGWRLHYSPQMGLSAQKEDAHGE